MLGLHYFRLSPGSLSEVALSLPLLSHASLLIGRVWTGRNWGRGNQGSGQNAMEVALSPSLLCGWKYPLAVLFWTWLSRHLLGLADVAEAAGGSSSSWPLLPGLPQFCHVCAHSTFFPFNQHRRGHKKASYSVHTVKKKLLESLASPLRPTVSAGSRCS